MAKTKKVESAEPPKITVSGVTFTAEQVKTATVTIDGRDVFIGEKPDEPAKFGFPVKGN